MRALLLATAVTFVAAGCSGDPPARGARVEVVASFAPLAEVAARVGGDRATVRDLTPAGSEPHALEPTPDQVEAVERAQLVLVLGGGFQPGVEELADARGDTTVRVLDAVRPRGGPDDDPHVWLDPVLMRAIVDEVADAFVAVDPDHAAGYRERSAAYGIQVAAVGAEYRRGLARCTRDVIVSAHDAFGWLAARYDLRVEAIAGISPDAEPDPERLASLAALVEREGVTTVFTESLLPTDLADTLAREARVRTAVLDPIEGFPDASDAGDASDATGAGWVGAMRSNLRVLWDALGCR